MAILLVMLIVSPSSPVPLFVSFACIRQWRTADWFWCSY
jgi:hypothetical protein